MSRAPRLLDLFGMSPIQRSKLRAIRLLADKLRDYEQQYARMSVRERDAFCADVGAQESRSWSAMSDAVAHWLAAKILE